MVFGAHARRPVPHMRNDLETNMKIRSLVPACLMFVLHLASAQTFPSKPLQLVIPSAPGAAYDLIGRVIADGIRDNLGSVVVDNRAGGNFTIGAAYVKRAPPDGHTVLLGGNVYVIGEAMNLTRTYIFSGFRTGGASHRFALLPDGASRIGAGDGGENAP